MVTSSLAHVAKRAMTSLFFCSKVLAKGIVRVEVASLPIKSNAIYKETAGKKMHMR